MADETRYEVGQVVMSIGRYGYDQFEAGTQVVYVGSPASSSRSCHVSRGGISDIMDTKDIRPLRPGEAPTIDSRGYPIEAKAKTNAELLSTLAGTLKPAWAEPDDLMIGEQDSDEAETLVAMANGLKLGRRIVRTVTTVIERVS